MKDLIELFKEGAQQQYRVAFLDAKDSEGTPITVTVLVDKADVKEFEKFLLDKQDDIFYAAEGGNVCYPE